MKERPTASILLADLVDLCAYILQRVDSPRYAKRAAYRLLVEAGLKDEEIEIAVTMLAHRLHGSEEWK